MGEAAGGQPGLHTGGVEAEEGIGRALDGERGGQAGATFGEAAPGFGKPGLARRVLCFHRTGEIAVGEGVLMAAADPCVVG